MSNKDNLTTEIVATDEGMRSWQQERAIFEITERICELMVERGVSRADLATRLGTGRSYITQLLDGTRNMTVRKISDVYLALGRQFHATDGPICTDMEFDVPTICSFTTQQDADQDIEQTIERVTITKHRSACLAG